MVKILSTWFVNDPFRELYLLFLVKPLGKCDGFVKIVIEKEKYGKILFLFSEMLFFPLHVPMNLYKYKVNIYFSHDLTMEKKWFFVYLFTSNSYGKRFRK